MKSTGIAREFYWDSYVQMPFPHGDTLGIMLSFLSTFEILHGQLYLVSQDWMFVLKTLAHSWGNTLDLSWTKFKHTIPFYAWKHITEVWLPIPEHLDSHELVYFKCMSLMSIRKLELRFCSNTSALQHSSSMKLEYLDLTGYSCRISPFMSWISSLPLRYLDLSACQDVSDVSLSHLSDLPLQTLKLCSLFSITNDGLRHLHALPLQHLELSATKISDDGLTHLVGLPLEHIVLNCCGKITDAGLLRISGLPLKHIELAQCYRIAGNCLKHFKHANYIFLSGNDRITDQDIIELACLPLLRKLYLILCPNVSEDAVTRLQSSNPQLVIKHGRTIEQCLH